MANLGMVSQHKCFVTPQYGLDFLIFHELNIREKQGWAADFFQIVSVTALGGISRLTCCVRC